jgi:hypothetical protein
MELKMRNKIIALVTALGLAFAIATPAKAQFWGGYGGWGYGGGWGYTAAIAGIGLATGALAGAAIANSYPYGAYPYAGYYNRPAYYGGYAPVYAAPVAVPTYRAPTVRKQIIIKNSPGAQVYEEDDIFGGW